jgi:hypothetical protein
MLMNGASSRQAVELLARQTSLVVSAYGPILPPPRYAFDSIQQELTKSPVEGIGLSGQVLQRRHFSS